MFDKTENDELTAREDAFVAQMVAKDAPAPVDVAAPVDDPAEPESTETATAEAPTPAVSDPVDGEPVAAEGTPPVTEPEPVEEEDEEVTDDAFAAAMAAERAPLSLDSIPEAARPLVQKKIKDLEGGFTRSMQRLAAERKEAEAIKAERRFQTERPDDYIVSLLLANDGLMDKVNAKLDEVTASPVAREAHSVVVERARERAAQAEAQVVAEQQALEQKAVEITRMSKAAARAAGVPWEMGVESEVAAHLKIHGDITEADIRAIAADKAKIWKKHLREQERTKSATYVEAKVKDRKTAGLVVKPATGTAPAPAAKAKPQNDDEFIAQFVASGR